MILEEGGNRWDDVHIGRMTWPEAGERMAKARGVILPLGSTEQHGYHMAAATDTVVSEYVCQKLAQRTDCLVLPALPYGQVWSAKGFPSTISLRQRTFIDIVKDIVVSLQEQQVRNVILFSGHYGNVQPSKDAARELYDEYGYRNVWHLSYTNVDKLNAAIMEGSLWNGKTFHAAELETSIMLHIAPELVNMEKAVGEMPEVPADIDLRPIPWKEYSKVGVFGEPEKATAEKGRDYLEAWIDNLCAIVQKNIL